MILKVNDTNKFNISMSIIVDWEDEEIRIHIKYWNKQTDVISGFDYSANEFPEAIKKFAELEKIHI